MTTRAKKTCRFAKLLCQGSSQSGRVTPLNSCVMLCIFLLLRKSFGEIYRKQRSDPSPRSWAHWAPCEAMRDQGLLGPWIHSASQICLICSQIISNPHAGVNNQITNGLVKKKIGQQIDESTCYNCFSHNGKPMIDSDSHDCQITMILKAQEDFRPQKQNFPELPVGSNISIKSVPSGKLT